MSIDVMKTTIWIARFQFMASITITKTGRGKVEIIIIYIAGNNNSDQTNNYKISLK